MWYDFFTGDVMRHGRHTLTQVTLQTVPVYVRGGSILPMSSVIRRASSLMWPDDIALLVAADAEVRMEVYFILPTLCKLNMRSVSRDLLKERITMTMVKRMPMTLGKNTYIQPFASTQCLAVSIASSTRPMHPLSNILPHRP